MKRTIAMLLVFLLVIAISAGCNGGSSTTPPPASSSAPPASSSAPPPSSAPASSPANTPAAPSDNTPEASSGVTYDTTTLVKASGQSIAQCCIPLVAGRELGFFAKYGLETNDLYYNGGPPQLEANPTGDWNIGWIGVTAGINGVLKFDMSVVGLSGFDTGDKILARADSDIYKYGPGNIQGAADLYGTPELWKGKTIISSVGTVVYCDLLTTLDRLGLTVDDINLINMDNASAYAAFRSGEGDLLATSSSWAVDLLKDDNIVVVNTLSGMGANMPGTIMVDNKYLKANEDLVVRYLAASLEALLYANDRSNLDQEAAWYQQTMSDEFGTTMDLDTARANVALADFRDLSFYEDLCKTDANGKTGLQNYYEKFYDNHTLIGIAEESNKDTVIAACDASYLAKAIDLYKKMNGIG